MDFHFASIQKVARTTYRGNTCKCLIASKRLRMQKKSCTCNFLKSCRCNFSKHTKTTGNIDFFVRKVAGAIFQMLQVQPFFACAAFFVVSGYSKCSDWSLMLECAVVIYNRKLDVVWFTSSIHILREGFKSCQTILCIPLWKLSPIGVLPSLVVWLVSISGLIALVVGLAAGAGPATEVPFLFRVFFVCNKGKAKEVNEEGVAKFGLASWWCWVWRSRCWAAVPRPRCWAWRAHAPQPQCWVIRRHGNGGSAEGESAMGVSCRAVNLFILIRWSRKKHPNYVI